MPIVSLAELCRMPGMPSQPSVRRFVAGRPDFPVEQVGRKGEAYRFDLDQALAFIAAHWRDGRNERRTARIAAEEAGGAHQLSLFEEDHADE